MSTTSGLPSAPHPLSEAPPTGRRLAVDPDQRAQGKRPGTLAVIVTPAPEHPHLLWQPGRERLDRGLAALMLFGIPAAAAAVVCFWWARRLADAVAIPPLVGSGRLAARGRRAA
jgi:hypothetical protein